MSPIALADWAHPDRAASWDRLHAVPADVQDAVLAVSFTVAAEAEVIIRGVTDPALPAGAVAARRLRQLGERGIPRGPRTPTRANPAGLTSRELDVLFLLAQDLRNAEIADRLIVSPKTVDHHVSSILRKLDVKTRGQAAAAAARIGLAQPNSTDRGMGPMSRRSPLHAPKPSHAQ